MEWIGIKHRRGQILSDPDWNLTQLGPDYLREAIQFIDLKAKETDPFFLYYVPNANHFQRNHSGDYAVPDSLEGIPIKGTSRYTDGTRAGEREDLIMENDAAFGILLKKLNETEDPRNPVSKLI